MAVIGFVPLKIADPMAQDLLWEYALRRAAVDLAFAGNLQEALRAAGYEPTALPYGRPPLVLSDADQAATWCGRRVRLTPTEYRVVRALARAPGALSFRAIYDAIKYPGFHAGDHHANVRSVIKRVRRKFIDVDSDFTAIVTRSGFGYTWEDPNDQQRVA